MAMTLGKPKGSRAASTASINSRRWTCSARLSSRGFVQKQGIPQLAMFKKANHFKYWFKMIQRIWNYCIANSERFKMMTINEPGYFFAAFHFWTDPACHICRSGRFQNDRPATRPPGTAHILPGFSVQITHTRRLRIPQCSLGSRCWKKMAILPNDGRSLEQTVA